MKKLTTIVAVAVGLATLARADEPVLSVDSNRILSLARQAIAESRQNVEMEAIEFADITYRLDAKQKETLRVSFRRSPETKVTHDDDKGYARTLTTSQVITVEMDRAGKILSVSKGGGFRKITAKSTRESKPARIHPTAETAMIAVAKSHNITYEAKILSATEVAMEFTIDGKGAEAKVESVRRDLEERLSSGGWDIVVHIYRPAEDDRTRRFASILLKPKKR